MSVTSLTRSSTNCHSHDATTERVHEGLEEELSSALVRWLDGARSASRRVCSRAADDAVRAFGEALRGLGGATVTLLPTVASAGEGGVATFLQASVASLMTSLMTSPSDATFPAGPVGDVGGVGRH